MMNLKKLVNSQGVLQLFSYLIVGMIVTIVD